MLRRYRIKANEYEQVLKWVRKEAEENDEKSAEAVKVLTMPADWLPKCTWAHKTKLRLKKVAHGKQVLEVQDGEVWKRLVHEDEVDQFLRDELLRNGSDVPLKAPCLSGPRMKKKKLFFFHFSN